MIPNENNAPEPADIGDCLTWSNFDDYHLGILDESRQRQIETHLNRCADCYERHKEMFLRDRRHDLYSVYWRGR